MNIQPKEYAELELFEHGIMATIKITSDVKWEHRENGSRHTVESGAVRLDLSDEKFNELFEVIE